MKNPNFPPFYQTKDNGSQHHKPSYYYIYCNIAYHFHLKKKNIFSVCVIEPPKNKTKHHHHVDLKIKNSVKTLKNFMKISQKTNTIQFFSAAFAAIEQSLF